jgi:hypothetical protein
VEGASYRDLLNAYQFKRAWRVLFLFEAQGDHLACALHQGVETLCLSVASAKGGNRGNEIARLVSFDYDSEVSAGLHALPRVLTLSRYAFANTLLEATTFACARLIEAGKKGADLG